MGDPAVEAAQRVWEQQKAIPFSPDGPWPRNSLIPAAREALKPIRELHCPYWMNCINACCSGEQCRNGSRLCEGCGEYWPCETARLVYTSEELER